MSLSARGRALVRGQPWIAEDDVDPRGVSTIAGPNYDLALYAHPERSGEGVLVVKTVLQFVFLDPDDLDWSGYARALLYNDLRFDPEDYELHMAHRVARFAYGEREHANWSDDGRRPSKAYTEWFRARGEEVCRETMHPWTAQDRRGFMRGWKRVIHGAWELRYPLVTEARVAGFKRISVVYDIQTTASLTPFDHFEINAIHVGETGFGDGPQSAVARREGQAYIDNRDVLRRERIPQIGSAHEYGHMQGLPDEYASAGTIPHWTHDAPSIMNNGMTVRPRHYTPFAEWVGRQTRAKLERYVTAADLAELEYFVPDEGQRWTVANAGIYEHRKDR